VQQVVDFTSGWEDCGSFQCVFTLFQLNDMNTFSHFFFKLNKFFKFFNSNYSLVPTILFQLSFDAAHH